MAFRCAFRPFGLLPVALLLLATLALLFPWMTCSLCGGQSPQIRQIAPIGMARPADSPGWWCPACWDRGRRSPVSRLLSRAPAPPILELARAHFDATASAKYPHSLNALLDLAGIDRGAARGFPQHHSRFVPSDVGELYLLALSGSHGAFTAHAPRPWTARLFLFDLDGRLLDRVEIEDDDNLACIDVLPGPIRVDGIPALEARAKLRNDAPTDTLDLKIRRDRRALKLPPDTFASVRGGTVRLGFQSGAFSVR